MNKYFILLILLILTLIFIYFKNLFYKLKSRKYWEKKNKNIIYNLNNLLQYVYFDVLDDVNKKFLEGGTFLGCVRNNSIIPWDDDVDLGIYVKNKEEISAIKKKIIKKINLDRYNVKDIFFGLKIIDKENYSALDIFFYTNINKNKISYISKKARNTWPTVLHYNLEINKLSKCRLYNKYYNVPSNAHNCLKRIYGNSYNEGVVGTTHAIDFNNLHIVSLEDFIIYCYLMILSIFKIKIKVDNNN